jgi:hypothetical protein
MMARRASAISLLGAIAFAFVVPFVGADAESNLPACCRRNGAHHCSSMGSMGSVPAEDAALHAFGSRCGSFPISIGAPAGGAIAFVPQSEAIRAFFIADRAISIQTEPTSRVLFSRSRQKRGPPALVS